ncbi:ABC transporter substrate-binding protein [Caldicellulosiruptor morganii]|uniref:ABC transporter substrate-binding protein n=1 Tax=Caldicellulosiruptor morganii TaxID=1387555 RepID=A0ABY7BNV7_9FIRM|nr:ABC transporter substrate-binding protein [Caldicellulosiruptor morganii]WAM34259.1 ABC transporter substrate-binding protein [Caldicellulosiruptor morganii]
MKKLIFKNALAILVIFCFVLSLFSLAFASGSKTIRLGVDIELSGVVAQYGQRTLEGLKMAVEEINQKGGVLGKKIELVIFDNKSDKTEALNIATRLATKENVLAILGSVTSGATKSASVAATRYKIPIISPTATDDLVTVDERTGRTKPYVFRICFNDSFQGSVMANFALKTLKIKTAAIIYDASSDYSKGLYKNFKETFTKNGGKVVAQEAFTSGEKDFNGILTKIRDKNPQALFVPVYYDDAGLIIKQARELGMWMPILGADGFDDPKVVEKAGSKYATNIFFSTHYSSQDTDKKVQDFRKRYQQKYKIEPNALSALGYDLGYFIADAIKRANSTTDREKLRKALESTRNFVGITGIISIDAKHNAKKSAVIIEIKNGVQRFKQKLNP